MELSNSPFLCLTVILTVFIPKIVTGQGITTFQRQWCGDTTYTPNSTYQSNVQAVLNSISSDTRTTNGFYNFTVGHEPNRVSSFVLCRGDVPINTCRLCKQSAVTLLQQVCPDNTQAYGNSGYCSIFMSNQSIYGKIQDVVAPWMLKSSNNVSNADGFDKSLTSLMSSLQHKAASGNSSLKFATGQANLTGGQNIYALVQCTPDLTRQRCLECIEDSISLLPTCCIDTNFTASGVNIIKPSCSIRYDITPIYDNVPDYQLPPPPPPPPMLLSRPPSNITSNSTAVGKSNKIRHVAAFLIPIGASTILVIIIIVGIISRKNKKLRNSWMVKFDKKDIEALKSLQFSFGTIKRLEKLE
ncbi:hypothetical protein BVRB_8g186860 [Beta vulgaris subsp. vulgaris]|nr:hypothetical protein BVRB_8g186860 [Beta vulgaris subsp. vulgaris]